MDIIQDFLESQDKDLRLIGTLALYGTLYYKFDLTQGTIEWRGPIEKIFDGRSIHTWDHLMHFIRPGHGFQRIEKILTSKDKFECVWDVAIDNKYWVNIYEYGKLEQQPQGFVICGALNIYPACNHVTESDQIYKLASIIDNDNDPNPRALVIISLDNVIANFIKLGHQPLVKIVDEFGQKLAQMDDVVHLIKLTDNSFGVIIKGVTKENFANIKVKVMQAVDAIQDSDLEINTTGFCGMYPLGNMSGKILLNSAYDVISCLKSNENVFHFWQPSFSALESNQMQIGV